LKPYSRAGNLDKKGEENTREQDPGIRNIAREYEDDADAERALFNFQTKGKEASMNKSSMRKKTLYVLRRDSK
jgi:hypothetical protein